jgi:hypothetical protein
VNAGGRHRDVVLDLEIEDGVAVLFRELQQRDGGPEELRHGVHAVAHVPAIGERAVAGVAAAKIDHAVDDQPLGADVLVPELGGEAGADRGLVGDRPGRVRHRPLAPGVDLRNLLRDRLLDDLGP